MALEENIKIPLITWKHQSVFFILMLSINLSYLSTIASRLLRAGMLKILFYFNVFLLPSQLLTKLVFSDRASSGYVGTSHTSVDLPVQVLQAFRPETSTNLYPPLNKDVEYKLFLCIPGGAPKTHYPMRLLFHSEECGQLVKVHIIIFC